jgi:hypothetical protein
MSDGQGGLWSRRTERGGEGLGRGSGGRRGKFGDGVQMRGGEAFPRDHSCTGTGVEPRGRGGPEGVRNVYRAAPS